MVKLKGDQKKDNVKGVTYWWGKSSRRTGLWREESQLKIM